MMIGVPVGGEVSEDPKPRKFRIPQMVKVEILGTHPESPKEIVENAPLPVVLVGESIYLAHPPPVNRIQQGVHKFLRVVGE
ncbi:unnamed protein product [Orchesella dallaii]|uniref:Uncharacterized protein n=1 Tax=Orchesella dallaii TaxID=48710 RepID=A0ABP1R6C6_9HEXA